MAWATFPVKPDTLLGWHRQLVARYLLEAGNWADFRHCGGHCRGGDPTYAVIARSAGGQLP